MEENRAHNTRSRTSSSSRSISSSSPSSSTTTKTSSSSSISSRNQGRFRRSETEECSIECSAKSCQACSATMVADCVALCCCPLAVISLLALTFIKVPYLMGRRCLRRRKLKKKKKKAKDETQHDFEGSFDFNGRGGMERSMDIVFEFGEEGEMVEQRKSLCTGLIELDNVLLDLYQVGHLGFGRVSFTGIQPNAKGIS